jgi:hypothetical protein
VYGVCSCRKKALARTPAARHGTARHVVASRTREKRDPRKIFFIVLKLWFLVCAL